jgi:hypothetical protein
VKGALAQLGERLLCKHQVIGSIPIGSTRNFTLRLDENNRSGPDANPGSGKADLPPNFDIVNGFLNRCREVSYVDGVIRAPAISSQDQSYDYLAEIFLHTIFKRSSVIQACR